MNRISIIFLVLTGMGLTISCNPKIKESTADSIIQEQYLPLEKVLNKYVTENKITGGVGLVYEKGQLRYHNAFGHREANREEKIKIDDIFRIASMTKQITSVAAMMLYEEGKFDLDDPISKFIPEFSDVNILESINWEDSTYTSRPATYEIKIRHLFTFTSGLYYAYDIDSLSLIYAKAGISEGFEERDILLADNTLKVASMPLLHEPGERYHYGIEMDVLGRLVEIWSGKSLDQYFMEFIFDPLGMKDSYFYLPEEKYDRLVPVYMNDKKGNLLPTNYPLIHYPVRGAKKFLSGGADLSCTAYDYFLFCQMLLNKGSLNGVQILQAETVEQINTTHLETGDNDMGLGFGLLSAKTEVDLARSVGSITWGGFFSTIFWIDPAEEVIAILLLQMYPFEHWEIQKEFEDCIYAIIQKDE